jgi:CHAD domain-containing protein
MDATRIVANSVRTHWQSARTALDTFAKEADGSGLHALRVGLRRLVAALELASALDAEPPRPVVRDLRRLLGSLSPLRDLQVQEETLERLAASEPALTKAARELARERKRAARALAKRASRFPTERCERSLARCGEQLEKDATTPSAARLITLAAVARAYKKFDRRRRSIDRADHDALHRVRVAFKRYRYAVEIASPLFPEHAEGVIASMKRFQDELGAIQDASVLIETLSRAKLPKQRASSNAGTPPLELLEREREEHVARTLESLRAQLAATPPAFSEPFESDQGEKSTANDNAQKSDKPAKARKPARVKASSTTTYKTKSASR